MKSISNLPAVTVAMMVCAVLFCAIDFSRAAFLAPATTTTKTISKNRGLNGNLLHVRKSTNVKMVDVKNKNDTNEDSKFNFQMPNFPDLPDMKDAISDNIASLQNFQSSSSNNSQSTNSAAAGSKISSALAASSSQPTPSSSLSITQPPPPPFNPTDPETLISITKSFIATDFGIQTDQVQSYSTGPPQTSTNRVNGNQESLALVLKSPPPPPPSTSSIPFYGASLLSDDFLWVSANNLNDGRTGLLNKNEYLAAGRFFNLRRSFPDLEYKAHDFRLEYNPNIKTKSNQGGGVQGSGDDNGDDIKEITIRFTTLTTGTFRGAPLRLRSSLVEPNGKVMKCPPTSISITFSTDKTNTNGDYGKITKLVTDMVIDRQVGNTNGLSGIAAAAVCAGCPPNEIELYPPLMVLERFFARPMKPLEDKRDEDDGYLPPFPGSVMIQLAKGVTASYFGIDDPDLLSNSFSYIEPLMGPLNKEQYVDLFSTTYNVRDGIPNIDYQFQNYRVDPYNPYRVWVDTRARGLRIGDIGTSKLPKNVPSAMYEAPPETMSFTFDNDGFCMRITGAAVLDPLLGNTGGLGGVYGALYSTGVCNTMSHFSFCGILFKH